MATESESSSSQRDKTENDRVKTSNLVMTLRSENRLPEAIAVCIKSLESQPDNRPLRNVLADLYYQLGEADKSSSTLIENLKYLTTFHRDIKGFASRYYKIKRLLSNKEIVKFEADILQELNQTSFKLGVKEKVENVIVKSVNTPIPADEETVELMTLAADDSTFNEFVRKEKEVEDRDPHKLIAMLDEVILNRPRSQLTWRIDLYTVSIYERTGLLSKALKLAENLTRLRADPVAVRSLLRICRITKDYTAAEILFERSPELLRSNDFNIMYELVYYFEYQDDLHSAQSILRTITRSFATNLPALRTARNFYIRFGIIEEATSLAKTITSLYGKKIGGNQKFINEVTETETGLASKVQELYSELEHHKQLAAISDLTTGISHELGQPLTNIRYTIQFYKRKLEKSLSMDLVETVFASILEETERMGGLIRRLSPLTSSKGVLEQFDIMDRIRKRVEGERPRLSVSGIRVRISRKLPLFMVGDAVKFDQLVSNLLLNAIDAINEKTENKDREIEIQVNQSFSEINISFSDTGIGIPAANKHKIFDPFFSTKAPGQGEGLGLFIVWNLLKMLGGKISVDSHYRNGARFLVSLPVTSQYQGKDNA